MSTKPDILIVGAGLSGSILYLALQQTGYRVVLCDGGDFANKTTPSFDARSIALNAASVQILKAVGLWDALSSHATAVQNIQISSQGQFGAARFNAQDEETPLGYVVEMHRFYQILQPKLQTKDVLWRTKLIHYESETGQVTLQNQHKQWTLQPKLIVAADGTHSCLRSFVSLPTQTRPQTHYAVLANLSLRRPHMGRAFERFTPQGPLALLPIEDSRMALVWCLPAQDAIALQQLPEKQFMHTFYQVFGGRLGRFKQLGARVCVPLAETIMPIQHQWPLVFIGNAAQTLHPLGAQGFNLGLRDIAHLVQCVGQAGLQSQMLAQYHLLRETDRKKVISAIQGVLSVFKHQALPIRLLRSLALSVFEQTHWGESTMVRHASGLGGLAPDLACGFPLSSVGGKHGS
ncbi:MAG: FAD-dependent monooxygenase [Gammaproteobacteria bacterium]|nr:FAD-dependent monooxygenase [Gammaproteobacteria bacterium]